MSDLEIPAIPKEAMILIPGFFANAQDDYLEKLIMPSLTSRLEQYTITVEREPIKVDGQTGRRFIAKSIATQQSKILDIYEAYWLDLMEKLGEKSPKEQVLRGLYLFINIFTFKFWRMAKKSRYLFIQSMIVLLLVVLWYYGILAVTLTAIGQDPNTLGVTIPADWAKNVAQIGQMMGGWSGWVIASIFLNLLPTPINVLVNQIDFTNRYLEDNPDPVNGWMRDRIRLRVKMVLDDVLKEKHQYSKVTIVGHSHGVTIAVDLLADYYNRTEIPIRFLSLGGLMELYSYKVSWVTEETIKCLKNPSVQEWKDYYSKQDWLCTKTPIPPSENLDKFSSNLITFKVPLSKQMTGKTHLAYFFDAIVLEDFLNFN